MNIKEMRIKSNLTRKELCDLTKIPYRTLQDWELGKRTPPEYVVEYIKIKIRDVSK